MRGYVETQVEASKYVAVCWHQAGCAGALSALGPDVSIGSAARLAALAGCRSVSWTARAEYVGKRSIDSSP